MGKISEFCLATVEADAWEIAQRWNLGLELDQFCTAAYMDDPEAFAQRDKEIRAYGSRARIFHAPFNELFPCAIDPKMRALAMERYEQSYALARRYGISRIVCHGNYIPNVYFPVWYAEQSVAFWKRFLADKPADFRLYLENVLEPEPEYLRDIVAGIADPRCRLCLDVGHANVGAVSTVPIAHWVEICGPYLGHLHLHNNDRSWDWHRPLGDGSMDFSRLLPSVLALSGEISVTLEHGCDSEKSLLWLAEHGYISAPKT